MNNNHFTLLRLLALLLLGIGQQARAQAPGTSNTRTGLSVVASATTADSAETLYIGPGTYTIDGTWNIYSKNVWISNSANITGSGEMVLYNPSQGGGAASPTYIDHNASTFETKINVNVKLANNQGMHIKDIYKPGGNPVSENDYTFLKIGKNLDLAVDGANIWLDNNLIGSNGGSISNYSAQRMIIAGNLATKLIHVRMISSTMAPISFTVPLGIADGDYTPLTLYATVSDSEINNGHPTLDCWVSVVDYNHYHFAWHDSTYATNIPATITNPQYGMGRAWFIHGYPDSVTFQHSAVTNGSAYVDTQAYITHLQMRKSYLYPGEAWSVKSGSDYIAPYEHGTTDTHHEDNGDDGLWGYFYTKTSSPLLQETPNLSPAISFIPSSIIGTQTVNVIAKVYEFDDVATAGRITLYIQKDPNYILNFDPTATNIGGQVVENSIWTFDDTDPGYYILTTDSVIPAGGFKALGFTTMYDPNYQVGSTVINAIISDYSGGESNADNTDNHDDDKLDYSF